MNVFKFFLMKNNNNKDNKSNNENKINSNKKLACEVA